MISAVPSDPAFSRLVLTNPGTGRNIIKIVAYGEAGSYDLPGFENFALNAQSTVVVDLTEAIGGLPVGLSITGRDVFAATLLAIAATSAHAAAPHVDAAARAIVQGDYVTTAEGVRLYYKDWGPKDGPAVTFSHGCPSSAASRG